MRHGKDTDKGIARYKGFQILMDIDSAPCEIDLEPSSWLPSTSTLIYLIQQRFRAKAEAPTLIRWRRQLPD